MYKFNLYQVNGMESHIYINDEDGWISIFINLV